MKSPGQYIEVSSEQSPSLASALVCFFFFFFNYISMNEVLEISDNKPDTIFMDITL